MANARGSRQSDRSGVEGGHRVWDRSTHYYANLGNETQPIHPWL